jgi:hypothetical protein
MVLLATAYESIGPVLARPVAQRPYARRALRRRVFAPLARALRSDR